MYIHTSNARFPFPPHKKTTHAAVVTMDKALLWTDGRYFLQARFIF